eukprot:1838448-Prymnesium_polylepis.1
MPGSTPKPRMSPSCVPMSSSEPRAGSCMMHAHEMAASAPSNDVASEPSSRRHAETEPLTPPARRRAPSGETSEQRTPPFCSSAASWTPEREKTKSRSAAVAPMTMR